MNRAIILAGGSGTRFLSKVPKQFSPLHGRPLVDFSIVACALSANIENLLVVCHRDYIEEIRTLIGTFEHGKVEIIPGGRDRIDSTLLGFRHLSPKEGDITFLLEANRPFVTTEHVDRIYRDFLQKQANCAFYFSPIMESLFSMKGDDLEWADRSVFGVSQTPYVLDFLSVEAILDNSEMICGDNSDILSVLPASLKRIPVNSGFNNLKITYPEHMDYAEYLMDRKI